MTRCLAGLFAPREILTSTLAGGINDITKYWPLMQFNIANAVSARLKPFSNNVYDERRETQHEHNTADQEHVKGFGEACG